MRVYCIIVGLSIIVHAFASSVSAEAPSKVTSLSYTQSGVSWVGGGPRYLIHIEDLSDGDTSEAAPECRDYTPPGPAPTAAAGDGSDLCLYLPGTLRALPYDFRSDRTYVIYMYGVDELNETTTPTILTTYTPSCSAMSLGVNVNNCAYNGTCNTKDLTVNNLDSTISIRLRIANSGNWKKAKRFWAYDQYPGTQFNSYLPNFDVKVNDNPSLPGTSVFIHTTTVRDLLSSMYRSAGGNALDNGVRQILINGFEDMRVINSQLPSFTFDQKCVVSLKYSNISDPKSTSTPTPLPTAIPNTPTKTPPGPLYRCETTSTGPRCVRDDAAGTLGEAACASRCVPWTPTPTRTPTPVAAATCQSCRDGGYLYYCTPGSSLSFCTNTSIGCPAVSTLCPAPTSTNTPTPPSTSTPRPTDPAPVCDAPAKAAAKLKGDANEDCRYTLADFQIWLREFQGTDTTRRADFNASGTVTLGDFAIWLKSYQSSS